MPKRLLITMYLEETCFFLSSSVPADVKQMNEKMTLGGASLG